VLSICSPVHDEEAEAALGEDARWLQMPPPYCESWYRELQAMLPPGQGMALQRAIETPMGMGEVYFLSIREEEFPGGNIIVVRDEKLLAKLRNHSGRLRLVFGNASPISAA